MCSTPAPGAERVRGHAASAIVNVCSPRFCMPAVLGTEEQIRTLLGALIAVMRECRPQEQRFAMSGLACVAQVLGERFAPFYDGFMPLAQGVLATMNGKVRWVDGWMGGWVDGWHAKRLPLLPAGADTHATRPRIDGAQEHRQLRAQTMEAMALVGIAVGKVRGDGHVTRMISCVTISRSLLRACACACANSGALRGGRSQAADGASGHAGRGHRLG